MGKAYNENCRSNGTWIERLLTYEQGRFQFFTISYSSVTHLFVSYFLQKHYFVIILSKKDKSEI